MLKINDCYKKFIKLITVILLTMTLSSCCHLFDGIGQCDGPELPPTYPMDNPPPPKSNGTIYQAGHEVLLYQDHIASRIGDILTIRLEEATSGEKQANMKTDKITAYNSNNGSITNNSSTNNGSMLKPVLFGGVLSSASFDAGTTMVFDGKGATNEFNKLHGTISVTVTHVLSNNNLVISGESWITINQGREYVKLSGIVRPEDIEPFNTISSQRIANARIVYSGLGQVGDTARGGILTQLLYRFFPY